MTICSNLHLFLAGLWFAASQLSLLFLLQTQYSATLTSFLLSTSAWLSGAIIGVWLTHPRVTPWLWLVSGLSLELISKLWTEPSRWASGEATWCLIALSALVAGQLFSQHFSLGEAMGRVFFVEALGFSLGLVLTTVALLFFGLGVLDLLPILALPLTGLAWFLRKGVKT